jgi:hypothetical protein
MILPPNCYERKCIYYSGIIQPDGTEKSEVPSCEAYPLGIPDEIAYGEDLHLKVRTDQDNTIIFKREK